ncbi:MAG: hypothetical protein P4L56_10745 [Candidatus Sulfopaludibacter sp.]|nr:hypothetical protein [Candidatus Sulfopaludibacter sp.]
MLHRLWMIAIGVAVCASAQKYDGPLPSKPDLPYIKQAATLIPMETADVRAEKAGSGTRFLIEGAASSVKTPISLPIFILKVQKVAPEHLQLYKMEAKEGHREYVVGGANPPDVLHLEVTRLTADGLCRIAVSDPLEAGEYVLSGDASQQVYCFQVF